MVNPLDLWRHQIMHNFPIAICKNSPCAQNLLVDFVWERHCGQERFENKFSAELVQIMRLRSRYCLHFKCAYRQVSNDLFTLNEIKSTPAIPFTLGQDFIVYCADE